MAGIYNFSEYFSAYSEMGVKFNGTSNGQTYDITSDYHVIYASSTTYKVNITQITGGSTVTYTAWVLKDGTAVAVYAYGQNFTGSQASSLLIGAMGAYVIEAVYSVPQILSAFTSTAFVHLAGTSTIMLGPTSVSVSNYVANNLPLQINECGVTTNFSKFSIQTGTVSGETLTLLTAIDIAGSFTTSGNTQNVSLTFHITSLTKAS